MTTILSNPTSVRLFIGATALIFLSTIPVKGATTLTTGDIAVIGMSADSADEFAWVPLVNLEAGTQIYFTDHGFHSKKSDFTSINSSGDTLMLYTTPAGGVLAGVVQTVISIGADYAFTESSVWGSLPHHPKQTSPLRAIQFMLFKAARARPAPHLAPRVTPTRRGYLQ